MAVAPHHASPRRPAPRPTRRLAARLAPRAGNAGLTLIELVVAFTLLLILSLMALPVARVKVQREKERRLREALHAMRRAIDQYKDMADAGKLGELDPDNHGYPESLEVLVEGIDLSEEQPGADGMGGNLGLQQSQSMGMNRNRSQRGGFGGNSSFGNNSPFGGASGSGSAFGRRSSPFGESNGIDDPLESDDAPKKIRFLRKIPTDPITGSAEWGMRSMSDDPNAMNWGGSNVFDVFSLSYDLALDGTPYSEW